MEEIRNNQAGRRVRRGRRPAMEARDLHFAYGDNEILKGVNVIIEPGKITTIMGANGCGKSTLFSLMTKNLTPDRGRIFLEGINLNNLSIKDFAKKVAIVQQYNSAAGDITVRQLVAFGRTPHIQAWQDTAEEDERMVNWAMEVTNLTEFADREVARLSGGQRQRVWIAMALAQGTQILFLDEPTTYLDVRYQIDILELVRRLNRVFGMTIIMVLHDINQAICYSDVVVGLHDGRVGVQGDPRQIITRESIRRLYGVDLEVMDVDGKKFVLPAYDETQEVAPAGAPDIPSPGAGNQSPGVSGQVPGAGNPPTGAAPGVQDTPATDGSRRSLASRDTMEIDLSVLEDLLQERGEPQTSGPAQEPPDSVERRQTEARADALPTTPEHAERALIEPAPTEPAPTEPESTASPQAENGRADAGPPPRKKISRLWVIPGVICLGLGTVGVVLPILPTVPFYLATLFCFAKGSQRLYDWFVSTKLYHKHLEGFVRKRAMTLKSKLTIMITVTAVMAFGFIMMSKVPVGRISLAVVWVAHVIFFVFGIKTVSEEELRASLDAEELPEGEE